MSQRERMLAAIHGESSDAIPWVPRLDLWYIANRARGTLPDGLTTVDLRGLADWFGLGCHAVRADFTRPRAPDDWILRGLGLENHPDFPYRIELDGVRPEFESDGESFLTRIRLPAGEVETALVLDSTMRCQGVSVPHVTKYPVTSLNDLDSVAEIFEHLEVVPDPAGYAAFRARIGEAGIAVANGPLAASPMHLVLHELMDLETFIYAYVDAPDALRRFADRLTPFFDALLDVLLHSDAEVMWWGANYDQSVTWPAFFRDEIAPWLARVSERAHAVGKSLLTHADGENHGLLALYPRCGIDVAESVCARPMVSDSLAELRAGFGPTTTIWGGIPSIALLTGSMNDHAFARFLDQTFASLGTGERLILGVSDNVPPDADLSRLGQIAERIEKFGPVIPVTEGRIQRADN